MSKTYLAALAALALAMPAAAVAQNTPTPPPAGTDAGSTAAAPGQKAPAVVKSGRLEETHGGWRTSRLVGADVYDDHDKAIGTIDDLIAGKDGKLDTAVLSVGGFLGIGSKLVAVPYDQLKFEERSDTEGTGAVPATTPDLGAPVAPPSPAIGSVAGTATAPVAAPANGTAMAPAGSMAANGSGTAMRPTAPPPAARPVTYKMTHIVLPGATVDSLKSMTEFSYQP